MAATIPISTVLYFPNILAIDLYLIYCFVSYFIVLWQKYSYWDMKIVIIQKLLKNISIYARFRYDALYD